MGASSWYYFTPYHPNPNTALRQLRQEVFEAGDYAAPALAASEYAGACPAGAWTGRQERLTARQCDSFQNIRSILNYPILPPELRAMLRASLANAPIYELTPEPFQPSSIDELLEEMAETGTHSILDITFVATRRRFGAATQLSTQELLRYFGTLRPTHDQAGAVVLDIAERLGHWEARFFPVYRDDEPTEYAFIGCTGE